jgi:hypothetical protein
MTIPPRCSPRLDTSSHTVILYSVFPWPPKGREHVTPTVAARLARRGPGSVARAPLRLLGVTSRIWLISPRHFSQSPALLTAWALANTTRAFPESDVWANETNGACPSVAALTTSIRIRAPSFGLKGAKIKPRQGPKGQNSGSAGPLAARAGYCVGELGIQGKWPRNLAGSPPIAAREPCSQQP